MKKLTSKTTMTIRATMVLLLAAGAATPRSIQTGSRGGSMGHSSPSTHFTPGSSHQSPSRGMQHQMPSSGMQHHTPTGGMQHQGPTGGMQHHTPTGGMQHQGPTGGMQHHTPAGGMQHQGPTGGMQHHTPAGGMQHQGYGKSFGHSTPGGYGHSAGSYHHEPVHGGYVQRSHVRGGVTYVNRYRPYHYRGYEFHAYAPGRFFAPRFYGWVDSPWAFRAHYRWGWFGSPWFAAYRGYFTPYAVYSSAPYWLTDYLVATSLQESWQAGMIGCSCRYGMSDGVKQAIAMEVHRQIVLEKAEATGYQASTPSFLDGQSHAFVVTNPTTANAGNQACALTGGDVVQLDANSQVDGGNATVQVVASKGQDCATGSYVGVTLAQLQEMQNGMRETIDQGMTTLQAEQGQNGLPAAPAGM